MNLTRLRSALSFIARFMGRLSIAATHILVVTLLVWLLLRFYPGDRWLFVRLGSYFAPWLLMLLFPTLVIALLARRRWLTGFILSLIIIFATHYGALLTPRLPQARAKDAVAELRVMTFNVHCSNRNAHSIAHLIQTEKPDVIALQEVTEELAGLLLPELVSKYPYHLVDNSWGLPMVLVSRYPLIVQPKLPETPRVQLALVETPHGAIAVWNVHPSPAVNQPGWEVQRQALAAVASAIEEESGPLIVLGDFNTTDLAENYHLMTKHLIDVHRTVGRGFGFTFPEPDFFTLTPWYVQPFEMMSPMVRIDHILVSEHFTPQETHVVPEGYGSDHRPVVATLRFAR